jgi:hypothetical protein
MGNPQVRHVIIFHSCRNQIQKHKESLTHMKRELYSITLTPTVQIIIHRITQL